MDKIFKEKIEKIEKSAHQIPGVVIIHNIETLCVEYMSPRGLKELGLTLERLQEMGADYNRVYFNEEDTQDYIPKMVGLMERGNEEEVITFFQQVRFSPEGDWVWHLSSTRIFHKNQEGKTTHFITIATSVDPHHHITSKVNRLLEENNFLRKNQHIFSSLTKQEKKILGLTALGKSSLEIAEELFISEATAKTHRRNLKSKINANTTFDITKFALAFDMI